MNIPSNTLSQPCYNISLLKTFSKDPNLVSPRNTAGLYKCIYSCPWRNLRSVNNLTPDRLNHLKYLIVHIFRHSIGCGLLERSITLMAVKVVRILSIETPYGPSSDEMSWASPGEERGSLTRSRRYNHLLAEREIHNSESYNALLALYAVLLFDFNDLSEKQKLSLLQLLQLRFWDDTLSPTEILEVNYPNGFDFKKLYLNSDVVSKDARRFISIHFPILNNNKGVKSFMLHANDLVPIDMPPALEAAWPFKDLDFTDQKTNPQELIKP